MDTTTLTLIAKIIIYGALAIGALFSVRLFILIRKQLNGGTSL